MTDYRDRLREIKTFPSLVKFLREDLDWPIAGTDDFEDLTFDYAPEELGIDATNAAKIEEIKRLRPLVANQPWGIFFVKFEPKQLPVVVLRRILNGVVVKKRATPSAAEQQKWATDDLLFISNYGEGEERRISFAHFSRDPTTSDLPTLKVLAWDDLDTPLHLEYAANALVEKLAWPASEDEWDDETWRERWSSAFELRHREVITTSKALAERLAVLARAIRDRIKTVLAVETADGPVTKLMEAFREALIHDLDVDDFADMYAQTIAYGLLSARVTNPTAGHHDRPAVHIPVTNPFLKELMESFLDTGQRREAAGSAIDFDELGVTEVVELLDDANMEAVVRDFGDRNPQEDPVIHFYELFLKEYDAKKRMQRGVFYTPRPVVSHIVRSVDEMLRAEFGLADGLADTTSWYEMAESHGGLKIPEGIPSNQAFVQILDPATGTGTFLVEAIDLIHKTLAAKWEAEGHSEKEIGRLWNEYVPEHLLPRLHGYELLMAPYAIAHLKIGLKLHETGYCFGSDERARVYLTNALEPAHDFSGQFEFAIPALAHEAQAVNAIKQHQRFTVVLGNPPYSRASANRGAFAEALVDRYKSLVRDERNIQPLSDDYIKFIAFGQHCIAQTSMGVAAMITNNTYFSGRIHRGMRRQLLEHNAVCHVLDLHGSGNVRFLGVRGADDENVFDILQGVGIGVFARGCIGRTPKYSEIIGSRKEKYRQLSSGVEIPRIDLAPCDPYFLFVPRNADGTAEFAHYVPLTDIFSFQNVGGKPGDDRLLVAFAPEDVLPKLRAARDTSPDSEDRQTEAARNLAALPRDYVFAQTAVMPYAYRPLDTRYVYYEPRIWTRAVEPLRNCIDGSLVLLCTKIVKDAEFRHVFVTRRFPDVIALSNTSSVNCYAFPQHRPRHGLLSVGDQRYESNMKIERFAALYDARATPESVMAYIYAVLHSPEYRRRFYEPLQLDFPRIPLATTVELFEALQSKGQRLIGLHLLEVEPDARVPSLEGDGEPKVGRVAWWAESVWLDSSPRGATSPRASLPHFDGVPEGVWNFRVGSYRVCEKWLKDRKGRTLSDADIAHYQQIVVVVSETIGLMKEIDELIELHGGWPSAFIGSVAEVVA
jgi:type I restriction-modification system DNA methylase subunit